MKCENFSFFCKFLVEKFCGLENSLYLCIRFRPENGARALRESSLKVLHKTEEVVVQEARD